MKFNPKNGLFRRYLHLKTLSASKCAGYHWVRRFVIASIIIFLVLFIYYETYVWQVVKLGEYIRPSLRDSCPKISLSNSASALVSDRSSKNLAILFMHEDNGNHYWGDDLMKRVIKNRQEYARRHGYSIINAKSEVDKSKPVAWSKLIAVKKYLDSFEYILYTDMDLIIMNMSYSLDDIIQYSAGYDIVFTEDWNGPNTGIFLARNTSWTRWFLTTAFDQKHLLKPKSKDGTAHPFEYEQRAIHYLLNTKLWRRRRLPKYHGNIDEIRHHVLVLPQCMLNSYAMHPLDWRGNVSSVKVCCD